MKIWRAYLSNHSSQYAVLGKFRSTISAKKASKWLNRYIRVQFKKDTWDWEEEYQFTVHGKIIALAVYTAGADLDTIANKIIKLGGQVKVRSEDDLFTW